jgi:hypothetical protein
MGYRRAVCHRHFKINPLFRPVLLLYEQGHHDDANERHSPEHRVPERMRGGRALVSVTTFAIALPRGRLVHSMCQMVNTVFCSIMDNNEGCWMEMICLVKKTLTE